MSLHNPPILDEVVGEVPVGAINSTNAEYTTASDFQTGTLKVYLNGMRQKEGVSNDYTITGSNSFTFNDPPKGSPGNPDLMLVDYIEA